MAQETFSDGNMRDGQTGTERIGGARRDEACNSPLTESYEETKRPAGVWLTAKLAVNMQCAVRFSPPGLVALFFNLS